MAFAILQPSAVKLTEEQQKFVQDMFDRGGNERYGIQDLIESSFERNTRLCKEFEEIRRQHGELVFQWREFA
jgi:hypothetical protein